MLFFLLSNDIGSFIKKFFTKKFSHSDKSSKLMRHFAVKMIPQFVSSVCINAYKNPLKAYLLVGRTVQK